MLEWSLPSRFLLRGSVLLVVFLGLWWLALLAPLTALLRGSAGIVLHFIPSESASTFSVTPSGDCDFRIPVQASDAKTQAYAVEFTVPRGTIIQFTFSLPIYWALAIALPVPKRKVRRLILALILGSVLVVLAELLSFVGFIEISTWNAIAQLHPANSDIGTWLRDMSGYLIKFVGPFLTPFVVVFIVHRRPDVEQVLSS